MSPQSKNSDERNVSKQTNFYDTNKLNVGDKLGNGGLGSVQDATYNNEPCVLKSSLDRDNDSLILEEFKLLSLLNDNKVSGIPKILTKDLPYYNEQPGILMQKLGPDLNKQQRDTNDGKFSLEKTLHIVMQALKTLESIHSCGIVHNDIKPENLMYGLSGSDKLYLIDFGLSTNLLTKYGEHIRNENTRKYRGTWAYSSFNSLNKRSTSRRDDLESLAYVLVKLRTGKLPWDDVLNEKNVGDLEMERSLMECRIKPAKAICKGMRKEFVTFLDEVRKLGFCQRPDYSEYYDMFKKVQLELQNKEFEEKQPNYN